jgi:H+/gluconate symporter-like permease
MKDTQNFKLKLHYRSYVGLTIGILMSIAAGYLSYYLLFEKEKNHFESDYDSLSQGIATAAGKALTRVNQVASHTALMLQTEHPDTARWPYVVHKR